MPQAAFWSWAPNRLTVRWPPLPRHLIHGGKGEAAALELVVAKSGRTTGLTCGSISALALDVTVDYYLDCAETKPYLTKTFTNQLAISGNQFSDAGDSGSLVVDAANAEPVGLTLQVEWTLPASARPWPIQQTTYSASSARRPAREQAIPLWEAPTIQ